MSDGAQWYVVHTYSGYENTVKATIEKYVENRGLQDLIHEISIPLETVTEITDNGPKEVERKVFPGYVLVKMVMTDECWHIVRNIRGVTGFLGSGNKPIPCLRVTSPPWAWRSARSWWATRWETASRSPMAPWSPSWAQWRRSTWTAARSVWWCPCLDRETPVELGWTRWSLLKPDPSKHNPAACRRGPWEGDGTVRPASWTRRARPELVHVQPHFSYGGALSWHRK